MSTATIPTRSEVDPKDTWDLDSLFASDEAWEEAYQAWEKQIAGFAEFQGKLGEDPATLAKCLQFDCDVDRAGDKLGIYAYLRTTEDTANSTYQRMFGRFQSLASKAAQAASYIRPEVLAISDETMQKFLESEELEPFHLVLERLVRFKPHTLSENEERLLAMQSDMAGSANRIFRQLNDADLKFGKVTNEKGQQVELTNSSFVQLLYSPDREVRSKAFNQFYEQFQAHENTLAATLYSSNLRDVYYARARNYEGSLNAALFPDNVPQSVYDNLIDSVHRHLPALYRYYDVRRRAMKLDEIHHYDCYVPILSDLKKHHTWDQAVDVIAESLEPLGSDYIGPLEKGLRGRWCDRYENKGKQSGAFSYGSFDADPFILMNYKEDVLDHVFTLTHEAGHSMHSYLSSGNQPYQYHSYTIFVAEVASTFNEQLLGRHLMNQAQSDLERAYLINLELDDIRSTIIRQTMFAEFEKITHELVEQDEPLTTEKLKTIYRELLEKYFGPEFVLDDCLSLECLRIPHFYRAFYVYKYATGMSAAIALSQRVLNGGDAERDDYLGFLSGGCSKDPLDLLRDAGVDMEQPKPVDTALDYFEKLVGELDELLT